MKKIWIKLFWKVDKKLNFCKIFVRVFMRFQKLQEKKMREKSQKIICTSRRNVFKLVERDF